MIESLARHHAVVEFKPDGTVFTDNEHFLKATGHRVIEIVRAAGASRDGAGE